MAENNKSAVKLGFKGPSFCQQLEFPSPSSLVANLLVAKEIGPLDLKNFN